MKNTLKNLDDCKVEITVEVPTDTWTAAQKKAFSKLASNVSLPGFRKGHAPEAMLKSHIDPNKVLDQAINEILPTVYAEVITENKVEPFYRPDVDVTKISDTDLTLKFVVTLAPKVTLGAYTGLHAEKEVASVTDEEVNKDIESRLNGLAELVVTDKAAEKGDTVVIDFEGFIDGVAFEGGKADNYSLELGSNSFVPGFEDALIGVKANENKDVEVTFPTQYVKELAGKKATFKCFVHEVKKKVIPELNDETVADLNLENVKTVDELKEFSKKNLLERKVNQIENKYYNDIFAQIVDNSTVEVASSIIDAEANASLENLKKQVEGNGLTFEQYKEITGKNEEALKEEMKKESLKNIKGYLVLNTLAAKEHLLLDDAEFDVELAKMADTYKMSVEDLKKALGNNLNGFRENIVSGKVRKFILENNK